MAATRLLCHGAAAGTFQKLGKKPRGMECKYFFLLHLYERHSLQASTWTPKSQLLQPHAVSEQGHRLRLLVRSVVVASQIDSSSIAATDLLASTSPRHCCSSGLSRSVWGANCWQEQAAQRHSRHVPD